MNIEKRDYFCYEDGGKTYFWSFVMPVLLGLVLSLTFSLAGITGPVFSIIANIVTQGSFIAYYFLYCKFSKISYFKSAKITYKIDWLLAILCVIVSVCCVFGFNNIVSCLDYVISLTGYKASAINIPFTQTGYMIASVFVLCILPAVGEELLFRGIILNSLRNKYNKHIAVIVSALLFALFHGNVAQLIYQFAMGIVLGYVAITCGGLVYSAIVHFLNNFIVLMFAYFATEEQSAVINTKFVLIAVALFVVTCAVLFALWYVANKRKQKLQKSQNKEKSQEIALDKKDYKPISIYYVIAIVLVVICEVLDFVLSVKGLS